MRESWERGDIYVFEGTGMRSRRGLIMGIQNAQLRSLVCSRRGWEEVRRFGAGGPGTDLCFRRSWLLSGGSGVDHQGGWCPIWERIGDLVGWGTGLQGGGDPYSGPSRCSPHLPHQLSLTNRSSPSHIQERPRTGVWRKKGDAQLALT